MWVWCAILAGAALATRFVPFRAHGDWHLWPTVVVATIALVVLATSLYVVYVLEILKVRRLRAWAERRQSEESDATERRKTA
jgi:UDP-GlcNAc:undecaprenyl-phosphate GlcNAc-1-phosphate transferase